MKKGKLEQISIINENFDTYKAIELYNKQFDELLAKKLDKYPMLSSGVSKGYGIFYGMKDSSMEGKIDKRFSSGNLEKVIEIADVRMYEEKNKIN